MLLALSLGYQILSAARQYWDGQVYPARTNYTVSVSVTDERTSKTERYRSAYDARSGELWVDPVSDYERSHPASGRGVDLCTVGIGECNMRNKPAPNQDFIGVPLLSPAYSFGLGQPKLRLKSAISSDELVREIRSEFGDSNATPKVIHTSAPALPEIATVLVYERTYFVRVLGSEPIRGKTCYHLGLTPLRDPGKYRIRDLWIDERNDETMRARIALNFVDGPGTLVPWIVDFIHFDGGEYISSERSEEPYEYAGKAYKNVTIAFEDIRERAEPLLLNLGFSAFLVLREP